MISRSSLFEDLKEGLEEAIAYEKGTGKANTKTYVAGYIDRICKKGKGNGNFVCGFLFPFLLLVY